MNKVIEKAKKLNRLNAKIPELDIGDEVILAKVWDGEGKTPVNGYSYLLTHDGEDGNSNYDIWINYIFKFIEVNNTDPLKSIVKIEGIYLI